MTPMKPADVDCLGMLISTFVRGRCLHRLLRDANSTGIPEMRELREKQLRQNTCIMPTYAPVCDSPAIGLVGEFESRGVANTEKVPFLLLFTYATVPYRNVRALR